METARQPQGENEAHPGCCADSTPAKTACLPSLVYHPITDKQRTFSLQL